MSKSGIIIGADKGLANVMQRVELVANKDFPILIHGESGTGKEVVAYAIHCRSKRKNKSFVRVNCGAIAPELIDSELFGHEKGAFTGTVSRHKGWFEQADGGTLLLDEMGELPLGAQVRLLRVIQDGEFSRVGGETPVRVDVRIIAATHRDLPSMIEEKLFREDLYYRLATFPLVIPPLRERKEDFVELAAYFATRAANRFGYMPVEIFDEDIQLLQKYEWPGNVREFAAVIDRAVLLGDGNCLEMEKALGISLSKKSLEIPGVGRNESGDASGSTLEQVVPLDDVIKSHIEKALAICHGRVEGPFGAAIRLQVKPNTLRSKVRKYGIRLQQFRK